MSCVWCCWAAAAPSAALQIGATAGWGRNIVKAKHEDVRHRINGGVWGASFGI